MPLKLSDALAQYGFIGQMANAIPALKWIFLTAAKHDWPVDRLNLAIRDSDWFKLYGESARNWITLNAVDPATARRNLLNATSKVKLIMNEMGLAVNGETWTQLATAITVQGMNSEAQIRAYLAANGKLNYSQAGTLTGSAAQMEAQMRQIATDFGVAHTADNLKARLRNILAGTDTLEGWTALMRARAKATYSHFAEQFDSGLTLRDVADPYISTMANTLEIAESDIDLTDPNIKKALTQNLPDGIPGAQPLWQFERQLKNDPRWDKTKQARTAAFETIHQIGRDFGLAS